MKQKGIIEYVKDYEAICFRVEYSMPNDSPEEINFAAQPYEEMDSDEMANNPNYFLIYGKLDYTMSMHVGYKGFVFKITEDLHNRIGEMFKIVRAEYLQVYSNSGKIDI